MRRGLLLPEGERAAPVETAVRAEELGYDALWLGELWGADAFVQLAAIAARVDEAALGTAIVNVYSRSPATLAAAAATLDSVADGPVRLGLGASTPKAIEDLHGSEYDRPVRRIHETAELVRAFTRGEGRVEYDGELFSVADFPPLDAEVPIYVAALGPAARRMTGRVADGWIPHNVPFSALGDAFETVANAAREAGRDPDGIAVAPYVPAAVSDDPEEARAAVRGHLAYYVGSGEGYRRAVAEAFPDEADRVAEAWRAGDRAAAKAAVTAEMVDALGVAGTPDGARERFSEIAALDAVDEPIVVVPMQAEDLRERTVETLAPENR
ncbi:LLM class flavin-dependent oxidoreductase [Halegenticoccus tardaugens]|uniref:LLM class flavin-dependent oxidoreductase n=1 Tax=Halegenticoccus tardaugens TaxID=2071624 RepID=UPI00100C0384|nr:LLM class flavin-dependent oxidoreductase [Halegenticoccus tardaugens]